jgi:hypothetical protein
MMKKITCEVETSSGIEKTDGWRVSDKIVIVPGRFGTSIVHSETNGLIIASRNTFSAFIVGCLISVTTKDLHADVDEWNPTDKKKVSFFQHQTERWNSVSLKTESFLLQSEVLIKNLLAQFLSIVLTVLEILTLELFKEEISTLINRLNDRFGRWSNDIENRTSNMLFFDLMRCVMSMYSSSLCGNLSVEKEAAVAKLGGWQLIEKQLKLIETAYEGRQHQRLLKEIDYLYDNLISD